MCGRFVVVSATEVLRDMFGDYEVMEQYEPSFNIAPSAQAPVYLQSRGKKQRRNLQWGLVPVFSKDPKIGFKMINARAETIHKLPSFREPFRKRRCVVPADGFFEWRKLENSKVPYYIQLQNGKPMLFAGIYDHWKKPDGSFLSTFSISTVPANRLMTQIHNDKMRMPAILSTQEEISAWLDNSIEESGRLRPLLKPLKDGELKAHIITKYAGSPQNNHERIIEKVSDEYIAKIYGNVPSLY